MKGRFKAGDRVRLRLDVQRGPEPWPRHGQELRIIRNEHEHFDMPPLYLCEWDVAGRKLSGTPTRSLFFYGEDSRLRCDQLCALTNGAFRRLGWELRDGVPG